ncbi:MAG: hypothetical protein HN921_05480 [Bacteroidetes bacterium]|jgi:hypothetical protein|nr:hypothetical protein [Bacteroidota bacterium]MBT7039272.1 hypothetical protein [Bacteroidota bacterium]
MKKLILLFTLTISPILAQCDWNVDNTLKVMDEVETVIGNLKVIWITKLVYD